MGKTTKKHILITGGAGFLGSHLVNAFLKKGWLVTVIDNLSTGRIENLSKQLSNPSFTFIQADICSPLPEATTTTQFDVIANLASPASPPQYYRLALETLKAGTLGVMNLIDLATQQNTQLFHTSTSEVYGDPSMHPQKEEYWGNVNCYGPRSMYDESKRAAEAALWVARNQLGTKTNIVRIFNTYGPNMDPADGRVVSNFIMQALRGDPITIYGDGGQTRSFCYVDDLIDGFIEIISRNVEGPINLGNPGEFTMLELAKKVIKLTESASSIVHQELPANDPTQRKPDITKAKNLLNWEPTISLDEGLKVTIEYFRDYVK